MRSVKVILIVLLCMCGVHYAWAQQLLIKGLVTSSEDKQPLIGATVSVKGAPGRGVVTYMESWMWCCDPNHLIWMKLW